MGSKPVPVSFCVRYGFRDMFGFYRVFSKGSTGILGVLSGFKSLAVYWGFGGSIRGLNGSGF